MSFIAIERQDNPKGIMLTETMHLHTLDVMERTREEPQTLFKNGGSAPPNLALVLSRYLALLPGDSRYKKH